VTALSTPDHSLTEILLGPLQLSVSRFPCASLSSYSRDLCFAPSPPNSLPTCPSNDPLTSTYILPTPLDIAGRFCICKRLVSQTPFLRRIIEGQPDHGRSTFFSFFPMEKISIRVVGFFYVFLDRRFLPSWTQSEATLAPPMRFDPDFSLPHASDGDMGPSTFCVHHDRAACPPCPVVRFGPACPEVNFHAQSFDVFEPVMALAINPDLSSLSFLFFSLRIYSPFPGSHPPAQP